MYFANYRKNDKLQQIKRKKKQGNDELTLDDLPPGTFDYLDDHSLQKQLNQQDHSATLNAAEKSGDIGHAPQEVSPPQLVASEPHVNEISPRNPVTLDESNENSDDNIVGNGAGSPIRNVKSLRKFKEKQSSSKKSTTNPLASSKK